MLGIVEKERLSEFVVSPVSARVVELFHTRCSDRVEVFTYPPPMDVLLQHIEDHEC